MTLLVSLFMHPDWESKTLRHTITKLIIGKLSVGFAQEATKLQHVTISGMLCLVINAVMLLADPSPTRILQTRTKPFVPN